jgi:hypothetical protein
VLESVVQRALAAARDGRHFLLCGDPVPPGEVVAVPSGARLGRMHVCLLDATADAHRGRLLSRGDREDLIPRHLAFAEWMRHHVHDPRHRPEVIASGGWEHMQWERLLGATEPPWTTHVVDTTDVPPAAVAQRVFDWIQERLAGESEAVT